MHKLVIYWRHSYSHRDRKLRGKYFEHQIVDLPNTNQLFTIKRKLERERKDGAKSERHEVIHEREQLTIKFPPKFHTA